MAGISGLSGLSGLSGVMGGGSSGGGGGPTAPSAPLSLTLVYNIGTNFWDLNWLEPASDGGSAITLYTIYVNAVSIGTTTDLFASYEEGVEISEDDEVYVTATNAEGESGPSNEETAAIPPPGVIGDLQITYNLGEDNYDLTWSHADGAVAGYNVYVNGVYFDTPGGDNNYYDITLTEGDEVYVTSYFGAEESAPSNTVIAEPTAAFDPHSLPNVNLDIDAHVGVFLDPSFDVSLINDESGAGNYLEQVNDAPRGVQVIGDLNGYNTLQLDDGKWMEVLAGFLSAMDVGNNDSGSFYVVMQYTNSGGYVCLFDSNGGALSLFVNSGSFEASFARIGGAAGGVTSSPNNFTKDSWIIISVIINPSGNPAEIYCNGYGPATSVNSGGDFDGEPLVIGANPSGGGGNPIAKYARMLGASSAHDTTDRQKMEGYLAHYYNLTGGLDASHPYKASPPTP